MTGTAYGLGLGPGDPQLITTKARDILARVPVIAYPAPEGGESMVRAIAAPFVPAGREEIVIATPMVPDRFPALEVYERAASAIAAHLVAGRDVAILCEGDPFFYGSFMYLYERLAPRFATLVVPGVSSLTAVAAAAGMPLVSRNDVLTIVPAPLPEAELTRRLTGGGAIAIVKVGRHLAKIRRILDRSGLLAHAAYVERATMDRQRVLPLADFADSEAPYFSMILVPGKAWASGCRMDASTPLPRDAAILVLNDTALEAARRLHGLLPASEVHGLSGRVQGADVSFQAVAAHAADLFASGRPIVGVCAAGILIRALAPHLSDKRAEPPVLAVAEDLSAAVPLLGGHHGANAIARAIARATGAVAALTTAGDVRLGIALDEPPPGWTVANRDTAKGVAGDLLSGAPVALRLDVNDGGWLTEAGIPFAASGRRTIRITDQARSDDPDTLVLHPPVLAVGVGCERGADPSAVVALVEETLSRHGLARGAVACVASLDLKADEDAVHAVARTLAVPARFFPAATLEAETPRLANPSATVFREVGCHGVAEGAALAAAGADAVLVVEKMRGVRATCAVARSPMAIDPMMVGQARGSLAVVGIGPGRADWRTGEAVGALRSATDVVGYGLYLDLIEDLIAGKPRFATALGAEEDRVRIALDLAASGRRVALVSSGDAGVYGLATLVFEVMEREDRGPWNRIELAVVPGLTALTAAAARIGAPVGHDFCAISLSDLLTPWSDIERRLHGAAAGDFVVALYNPVSQRRRHQLAAARDILLAARDPATPVVLARNVGRDGERIEMMRLADLTPDCADMLTLVLVGSSQTRVFRAGRQTFAYTPRGYARKHEGGEPAPLPPAAVGRGS